MSFRFFVAVLICLTASHLQGASPQQSPGASPSPVPSAAEVGSIATKKISGVVKTLGSAINAKVYLVESGEKETKQPLCRDALAKRVGKLGGMTVEVMGDWRGDRSKSGCFVGSDFKIVRNASGREPMVGVLNKGESGWRLKSEANLEKLLADVPPGLAKLEGKLVIIDVKPMDVAGSKERAWRVVTYAEFP
jgi:hypothetical protein